jgi:hypothetical protein
MNGPRRVTVALERRPTGDHLVKHATKRPDVSARIHRLAGELLGRHVRHSAHDCAHPGQPGSGAHVVGAPGWQRFVQERFQVDLLQPLTISVGVTIGSMRAVFARLLLAG